MINKKATCKILTPIENVPSTCQRLYTCTCTCKIHNCVCSINLGYHFWICSELLKYSILPCQINKNNQNYYSSYSLVSFPHFCVTKLIILSLSYTYHFLCSNFHFLGCIFSVLHIKVVCLMCSKVSRLQLLLNYCNVDTE